MRQDFITYEDHPTPTSQAILQALPWDWVHGEELEGGIGDVWVYQGEEEDGEAMRDSSGSNQKGIDMDKADIGFHPQIPSDSAKELHLLQGGRIEKKNTLSGWKHDPDRGGFTHSETEKVTVHFWEASSKGEDELGPHTHNTITNAPILLDPKDFPEGTVITIEVPDE